MKKKSNHAWSSNTASARGNCAAARLPKTSFGKLPEREWTLLVQAVDQFVPEVGELLEHFRFLPSWRIDDVMISYRRPGWQRWSALR